MTKSNEITLNNRTQYLLFQIFGWGFFVVILGFLNSNDGGSRSKLLLILGLVFALNYLFSHFYRLYIIQKNWIMKPIGFLIIRILIASIILGILFSITTNLIRMGIEQKVNSILSVDAITIGILVYFIWSILYFVYLLFYKVRREQFINMEMLALNTEVELKNLRSQLNPHFMFNAMNSIRALVDEDPELSKKAITQLSNVLRNALVYSKKNQITIKEEMAIVDDYLSLEKIRYEERLQVKKEIEKESLSVLIPPLLLQTITENAIKHGIVKLMGGGIIKYEIRIIENYLSIIVSNTGKLDKSHRSETGIGVKNTIKRLKLIYGNDATFDLRQVGGEVKSEVLILLNKPNENNNSR